MPFTKVAQLSQLPPGEMAEVYVAGKPYAICHAEGEVYAIGGTCPHLGGPLGQGALQGHMVVCPWHAWEFDCRSGGNDRSPDIGVETVAVKVEGDDILIDAPF